MTGRTVYFEHTTLGDVARMTAIDSVTGTEAVVMGPVRAPRSDLEALALRKLERSLGAGASWSDPPRLRQRPGYDMHKPESPARAGSARREPRCVAHSASTKTPR